MGDKITITLDIRDAKGKKVAKLRNQGVVPGVIYGQGFDPILVQSEYNVLEKVVKGAGKHSAVHVTVDGKKKIALIKDIEHSPVKGRIQHVSFHAVKASENVHAEVPIHLVGLGESGAEKAGLIILQAIETLEIKAKPADLPEALEVSVSGLETDEDKILVSDITLPKGVEFADVEQDLDLVIANVYEPAALEAANEAAAGEAEDVDDVEVEGGTEGGTDEASREEAKEDTK